MGSNIHSWWNNLHSNISKDTNVQRFLKHREEGEDGEPIETYTLPEEAIRIQREVAMEMGVEYDTDDETLEDFVAVNWAVWVEKP